MIYIAVDECLELFSFGCARKDTRATDCFVRAIKATAYNCTQSSSCEILLQTRPKEKLLQVMLYLPK